MSTIAPSKPSTSSNSDKQAALAKGLEGVIGGQTSICSIEQGELIYRGYEIHDLAEHATFEEVAFLLLGGQQAHRRRTDAGSRARSSPSGPCPGR